MKNLIIPEELSKSFAKTTDDRKVTHAEFQKWFEEVVQGYHPWNYSSPSLTEQSNFLNL